MPADGRVAPHRGAQIDHRRDWEQREARLHALAAGQHGVVGYTQLRSLGFSGAGVRQRVATDRLHALHRGVYALGRRDLPAKGRWMAAVLACGAGSLLSHVSAAVLRSLISSSQAAVDVTILRRNGLARPGIRVHRSTCLMPADRALVDGIPCTSVARTLLDLAGVVPPRVLERACDQAEVLRLLDWAAMEDLLSRARGHAGVRKLRAVLETGHVGRDITRTELEQRFLPLCRGADLPPPEVNAWMALAREEMQVDFLWRRHRVIVEVDGFATHRTRQAFQRDRRRDQLLTLAGWRVIRFTWDDVTKDPARVIDVLRKLMSHRLMTRRWSSCPHRRGQVDHRR